MKYNGNNIIHIWWRRNECIWRRHDLTLKKVRDEWNEDRMKRLEFMNKSLCEKNEQEHTSTMLTKQWSSTIEYFQNE